MTAPFRSAVALSALALAFAAIAQAHDSYLLPQAFVSDGKSLGLDLTSAEQFPKLEYGPKRDRIKRLELRAETKPAEFAIAAESETALRMTLANGSGFQVAGAAFHPHDISLTPDKVAEYFAEIGAGEDLKRAYAALREPRQWNETYTKYAKTIVCLAPCRNDAVAAQPLNFDLEFVAAERGNRTPRFRLLQRGAPAANRPVAIWRDTGDHSLSRTDADGMVAIAAAKPGRYLLSAVIIVPPPQPGARFTSDFATLTFALDANGRFSTAP